MLIPRLSIQSGPTKLEEKLLSQFYFLTLKIKAYIFRNQENIMNNKKNKIHFIATVIVVFVNSCKKILSELCYQSYLINRIYLFSEKFDVG